MSQPISEAISASDNFWLSLKFISIIAGISFLVIIRSVRKRALIDTKDLVSVSMAVSGIVLAISLLARSLTSNEVLEVLKEDIVALGLGALAQGLASIDDEFKQDCLYLWSRIRSRQPPSSGSNPPPGSGSSP